MAFGDSLFGFYLASGPSFLEGNWAYNVVSLLVAVVGFWITIWQLYKTRSAAYAARESAVLMVDGFHRLAGFVGFSGLTRLANDIIISIESGNLGRADVRMSDLLSALVRASESSGTEELISRDQWDSICNVVEDVASTITIAALARASDPDNLRIFECASVMKQISTELNRFEARPLKGAEPRPEK